MSAIVVPQIDSKAITLGVEFTIKRDQALDASKAVASVTDAASQEVATQAASTIRGILNRLEKDRVAVKAPVLAVGKLIDSTAKDGAKQLGEELARLEGLIKEHYKAEQIKARRAQETRDKFAAARQQKLVAEAKSARQAAAEADGSEDSQALAAKAEELSQKAAEAPTSAPIVAAPAKAEKMTVRTVWKFEVTDIDALYAHRKSLCRLEANASAINAEIRGGMRECPGLRIYEEVDVTARS